MSTWYTKTESNQLLALFHFLCSGFILAETVTLRCDSTTWQQRNLNSWHLELFFFCYVWIRGSCHLDYAGANMKRNLGSISWSFHPKTIVMSHLINNWLTAGNWCVLGHFWIGCTMKSKLQLACKLHVNLLISYALALLSFHTDYILTAGMMWFVFTWS